MAVLYGPIGSACVQKMHRTLAAAAHKWDGADGMCLASIMLPSSLNANKRTMALSSALTVACAVHSAACLVDTTNHGVLQIT